MSVFDYYENEQIISAISFQLRRIRNPRDKEDCKQEIFAELYDFTPIDESDALRIVSRIGRKFRRRLTRDSEVCGASDNDRIDDRIMLNDGNYQSKAHYSSAD